MLGDDNLLNGSHYLKGLVSTVTRGRYSGSPKKYMFNVELKRQTSSDQ